MTRQEDAAYRARMGIVGALQSCACLYPIERAPTKTEHDEYCPAHRMLLTSIDPQEARALPPPFSVRRAGDGWRGRCTTCQGEFEASSVPGLAREMVASHNHAAATVSAQLRDVVAAVVDGAGGGR